MIVKRVLTTAVSVCVALALAACGGLSSGTVIERDYDDADYYQGTCYDTQYRWENRPVTRTRYVNGKSQTYTTTERRRVSHQVPRPCTKYDPERYMLRLRDGENEGWVTVSRTVYLACEKNLYYSEGKCRG